MMISNENSSEFSMPKPFVASVSSSLTKSEHINFCSTFSFHADELLIDVNDRIFPVADQICTDFCPAMPEKNTAAENIHSSQAPKSDNYINQMNEMNDHICQLSKTLSERNDELAALSAKWKNKYDLLLQENEELKRQLSAQKELPAPYNSDSDMIFVQSREL